MPVLSVCSSCGITTEAVSGGMMLFAPYNRGQCVNAEVVGPSPVSERQNGTMTLA